MKEYKKKYIILITNLVLLECNRDNENSKKIQKELKNLRIEDEKEKKLEIIKNEDKVSKHQLNEQTNYKAKCIERNLLGQLIEETLPYLDQDKKSRKLRINIIIDLIKKNNIDEEILNDLFFNAIETNSMKLVKALVNKGISLNYIHRIHKCTPYEYSCSKGFQDIANYLLELLDFF